MSILALLNRRPRVLTSLVVMWLACGTGDVTTMAAPTSQPTTIPAQPFHAWAPTPPMGWNSWDCFGTSVTEELTKQNADYMADKLLSHGWRLITVDIQWYEPNAVGHDYKKDAPLTMDGFGRLLPATNKFPSAADGKGFKPLAEAVHAKGLLFGIHLMRGIPRQAVKNNTPIVGSDLHADDIANTNDVCPWNPDMFGVDMTKPGAQAYYDSVFDLIASWGVDFVKVDDLSRPYPEHQPEIEAIRKAIDKAVAKTGRPMVLSTSPGETPIAAADHVATHANLWRISDDFWDKWPLLLEQFERCNKWAEFNGTGHYPDADMLALGNIRVGQKDPWTRFTKDEQLTHMTLWAIAKSPLIFGGHLPKNDAWTLSLMTNDDVIAMNQHGENPHQLSRDGTSVVWTSGVPDSAARYVAVFNLADEAATVDVPKAELTGDIRVRDLWKGEDVSGQKLVVPAHGTRLLRLSSSAGKP